MREEAEKISIVIPAYNCAGTIARCLASAFAQTYRNIEVIAVDDGSTDGTGALLDTAAEKEARLIVLHQPNGGVAAARNAGMRAACGTWLLTLDADDYIDPEMLAVMHGAARRADAGLCICGFRLVYEDGKTELREAETAFAGSRSELLNRMFLELYDRQLLNNQNNKLYRLELIRENGLFYDPSMQINEDLWFSLRYLALCGRVAVVRGAFLNYVQHREGESLVSRFHENCVDTCFSVLSACDALLFGPEVSAEIRNAAHNRMLFLICGYAGWQYYKTDDSGERLLANIRKLCDTAAFQKLLLETRPEGFKNRAAHFLLGHRMAGVYHGLCRILYRGKKKQIKQERRTER